MPSDDSVARRPGPAQASRPTDWLPLAALAAVLSVDKLATSLWTTVCSTCVKPGLACVHTGEMMGTSLPSRRPANHLTWHNALRALCIRKRLEFSTRHAVTFNKKAGNLSKVYPSVISSRDCRFMKLQVVSPTPC